METAFFIDPDMALALVHVLQHSLAAFAVHGWAAARFVFESCKEGCNEHSVHRGVYGGLGLVGLVQAWHAQRRRAMHDAREKGLHGLAYLLMAWWS